MDCGAAVKRLQFLPSWKPRHAAGSATSFLDRSRFIRESHSFRRGIRFATPRGMPEISRFYGIVIRMLAAAGPNLNTPNDVRKVQLIEEGFHRPG